MTEQEQLEGSAAGVSFSPAELRRLVLPLVAEQLLAISVGLADSIMVAGVSNAAVSAVSLVDSVSNLMIFIFSAFAAGGAVVAGQYLGRRDEAKARRAAEQLVVLLGVFALAVMAMMYLGKSFVLHRVFGKIEADVMLATDQYYTVVMASIPFLALYNAGAALMRTMQRSDVTFRVSLLMNAVNLGGNALLIFGLRMGVLGAAIPTLVSRTLAAAVILRLFADRRLPLHLRQLPHYRFDWRMVRNILSIAIPSGLENGMFHFGRLILTSLISTFGTASIMANAIGNTIGNFQIFASAAIGLGLTTVASRCVGAGDYTAARRYTRVLLKWCYLGQGTINILLLLATPLVLWAYRVEGETAYLATVVMTIHGMGSIVIYPTAFPLANTLRSAGDARFTMLVTMTTMWLCRVLLGYVCSVPLGMGVIGVYAAHMLDWVARSACFIHRYRGTRWQHAALE
ncbi:MAG: MATE family efflux transporter [Oscillospiraceae bacterium]